MAVTFIPPYFRARPSDRFFKARMLARMCGLAEQSELKLAIQAFRLPIRKPLRLGCDPCGWTCLMFACSYLNADNILYLLRQGSQKDADYSTQDGMTPLMAVVIASNPDNEDDAIICAEWLFLAKMDISTVSTTLNNGRNVLTMAVWKGTMNLVQYLIDHGADVNSLDGFGETPFNIAVSLNMRPMVELLYAAGANPCVKNLNGEHCIELAEEYAPELKPHIENLMRNYLPNDPKNEGDGVIVLAPTIDSVSSSNASKKGYWIVSSCLVGIFSVVAFFGCNKLLNPN